MGSSLAMACFGDIAPDEEIWFPCQKYRDDNLTKLEEMNSTVFFRVYAKADALE